MDSGRFDRLVRQAAAGASRRGVMRLGLGALAASALATLGLRAEDTEARKKRRRVCDCSSSDPASCNSRRVRRKRARRILRRNPCAYSGRCQPGVSGCGSQCPANRPVICGDGCCPAEYSRCCEETTSSTDTHSCNPPHYTCCPASQGGGSCPKELFGIGIFPDDSVCCPATRQTPRGWCAEAGGDCCTTEEGGFSCPPGATCCPLPTDGSCGCDALTGPWCAFADDDEICCTAESGGGSCWTDFPVCCPDNENWAATCCPEGSTCCSTDEDCGGGGSCIAGCCDAPGQFKYSGGVVRRARGRRSGVERFHMSAR